MKITMTLRELNTIGDIVGVQNKTYGGVTFSVFEQLEPYVDKLEGLKKAGKAYVQEHSTDGKHLKRYTDIPEGLQNSDGKPLSEEHALAMGVIEETQEWRDYMQFIDDQMDSEFTVEVTPVLTKQACIAANLTPADIRMFKKLGILVTD